MLGKGKRYDEDFKKTIVELHNVQKKSVNEIEREYGISNVTIYKWLDEYSNIKTDDGTITNNKEIKMLKKELAQTKEELEILKKAIAIFTQK